MKGGGRSARRSPPRSSRTIGAGNGTRTRDIKLGKLALYQLSYARSSVQVRVNLADGRSAVKGAARLAVAAQPVRGQGFRPAASPPSTALYPCQRPPDGYTENMQGTTKSREPIQ